MTVVPMTSSPATLGVQDALAPDHAPPDHGPLDHCPPDHGLDDQSLADPASSDPAVPAVGREPLSIAKPGAGLAFSADMSLPAFHRLAIADVIDGAKLWRLAWMLGWFDIRLRYRGSMLGPFWLTLSTGVMIAALGLLYSQLFKIALREYLPFLAISQILWSFIAPICAIPPRSERPGVGELKDGEFGGLGIDRDMIFYRESLFCQRPIIGIDTYRP